MCKYEFDRKPVEEMSENKACLPKALGRILFKSNKIGSRLRYELVNTLTQAHQYRV